MSPRHEFHSLLFLRFLQTNRGESKTIGKCRTGLDRIGHFGPTFVGPNIDLWRLLLCRRKRMHGKYVFSTNYDIGSGLSVCSSTYSIKIMHHSIAEWWYRLCLRQMLNTRSISDVITILAKIEKKEETSPFDSKYYSLMVSGCSHAGRLAAVVVLTVYLFTLFSSFSLSVNCSFRAPNRL